jgi:hypothetical protein
LLQNEELQQQQLSSKQREVLGIVQLNQVKAKSVEDPQLMARARSLMPLDAWRETAREQYELNRQLEPGSPTTAVEDLVVQSMMQWFKRDFFSWVSWVRPHLWLCIHHLNVADNNGMTTLTIPDDPAER